MTHPGPQPALSRRRLLTLVGALTTGAAAATFPGAPAKAAPPASPGAAWTNRTTQNSWPIVDSHRVRTFPIEGSDATVALRADTDQFSDVAVILLHVARRLHYELAPLAPGDIHGYTTDRAIVAEFDSNHLSGTAFTIRPGAYPPGSAGNLYPHEVAIVRDILADADGVVRWGGDDPSHPSEGHFQIDVPPASRDLARVATTIRGWRNDRGLGAGAPLEPSTPTRLRAAQTLERAQRR